MSETVGLAAYERVVEEIKAEIRADKLKINERLPGNRALADKHGVALGTLQKALKVLQDEGVLVSRPTVGVFVKSVPSEEEPPADMAAIMRQLDQLQAKVDDVSDRLRRLEEASERS
ncbi:MULTISPECIES: GntR family transcriptional regulator [unclassified Saccharothrix]|uniref:GntR family transcriptional regulator n=1 Tax=unclassified Saccharothrix TaxID=2593673 RepID=UPI00307E0BA7